MPLSKMPRPITQLAKALCNGPLRLRQMTGVGSANPIAIGMAASQTGTPGWAADRRGGIKAIKDQPIIGHGVQMGRLNHLIAVEPNIPPPKIISHDQNDIWAGGSNGSLRTNLPHGLAKCEKEKDKRQAL